MMTARKPQAGAGAPLQSLFARTSFALAVMLVCGSFACSRTPSPSQSSTPRASAAPTTVSKASEPPQAAPQVEQQTDYRLATAARVVAIGDLHGDFEATLGVLRLAGAVDANGKWVGQNLTVVQTGDQLDRGDGERKILDLFARLEQEAESAGGRFIVLNGNHEVMNVAGDFRYVTEGGFSSFADVTSPALPEQIAAQVPALMQGRATAFLPGGPYARALASRRIVVQVGETVFVHGALLEKHLDYGIDRMNRETSEWMRGVRPQVPLLAADDAPVWSRLYSMDSDSKACAQLARVLLRMGAKRMVVGHTIQQHGITSACNDRIWRIDVGMADHYGGGSLGALEITGDQVRALEWQKSTHRSAVGE